MADYSFEYCKNHMSETEEEAEKFSDFSIEELAKDLLPGNYIDIICEGYGFTAIYKDEDGEIYLVFSWDDFSKAVKFQDLENFNKDGDEKWIVSLESKSN